MARLEPLEALAAEAAAGEEGGVMMQRGGVMKLKLPYTAVVHSLRPYCSSTVLYFASVDDEYSIQQSDTGIAI